MQMVPTIPILIPLLISKQNSTQQYPTVGVNLFTPTVALYKLRCEKKLFSAKKAENSLCFCRKSSSISGGGNGSSSCSLCR